MLAAPRNCAGSWCPPADSTSSAFCSSCSSSFPRSALVFFRLLGPRSRPPRFSSAATTFPATWRFPAAALAHRTQPCMHYSCPSSPPLLLLPLLRRRLLVVLHDGGKRREAIYRQFSGTELSIAAGARRRSIRPSVVVVVVVVIVSAVRIIFNKRCTVVDGGRGGGGGARRYLGAGGSEELVAEKSSRRTNEWPAPHATGPPSPSRQRSRSSVVASLFCLVLRLQRCPPSRLIAAAAPIRQLVCHRTTILLRSRADVEGSSAGAILMNAAGELIRVAKLSPASWAEQPCAPCLNHLLRWSKNRGGCSMYQGLQRLPCAGAPRMRPASLASHAVCLPAH